MTSYATPPHDVAGRPVACAGLRRVNRRKAAAFFHLVAPAHRSCAAAMCFRRAGCNDGDAARNDAGDHEPPVQRARCRANPDIRFIFTNAGGTVPMLSGRIAVATSALAPSSIGCVPKGGRIRTQEAYLRGSVERDLAASLVRPCRARTAVADRLRHRLSFVPIEAPSRASMRSDGPVRAPCTRANAATLLPAPRVSRAATALRCNRASSALPPVTPRSLPIGCGRSKFALQRGNRRSGRPVQHAPSRSPPRLCRDSAERSFSAPAREAIAAKFGWKQISVPLFPRYIHDVCRRYRVLLVSNGAFGDAILTRLAVTSISTSLLGVE